MSTGSGNWLFAGLAAAALVGGLIVSESGMFDPAPRPADVIGDDAVPAPLPEPKPELEPAPAPEPEPDPATELEQAAVTEPAPESTPVPSAEASEQTISEPEASPAIEQAAQMPVENTPEPVIESATEYQSDQPLLSEPVIAVQTPLAVMPDALGTDMDATELASAPVQVEMDDTVAMDQPAPEIVDVAPVTGDQAPPPEQVAPTAEATVAEVVSTPDAPEIVMEAPMVAPEAASIGQPPAIPDMTQPLSGSLEISIIPATSNAPMLGAVDAPAAAPVPNAISASFDLVRVDPQGGTLVAGRAEPNAFVNITSGDEVLGRAQANERGEFVAFLDTPSGETQSLRLEAGLTETNVVASQDEVIILPVQDDAQQAAPVVLLATQDSVQIMQPSGLSIPDNISLDTISYNEVGNVQLAGRGQPNHLARVYVDQQVVGEAMISDSGGWSMTVHDIDAGRYVLRVDEIGSNDRVNSRVESPFQREFPEAEALDGFRQGARIIVQPGNTLWLMAAQAYGDGDSYTQIFAANRDAIRNPDKIYPGQVFSIPLIDE